MFASLDSIDIVIEPTREGRDVYIQTDHRSPADIEGALELSRMLALIRVLNCKRVADGALEPIVVYRAQHSPPAGLVEVVRTAGGVLAVGNDETLELLAPDRIERLRAVTNTEHLPATIAACAVDLAARVARDHALPATLAGLQQLEQRLAAAPADPTDDAYAYWSAVVELGTFAGELLRVSLGGAWTLSTSGTLPLNLTIDSMKINPLGKVIKRFANGEEDSVVSLVEVVHDLVERART